MFYSFDFNFPFVKKISAFNQLFNFNKLNSEIEITLSKEKMTSKSNTNAGNYKLTQMFGYKGPG